MRTTHISSYSLQFLMELRDNNNREWFAENKDRYLTVKEDFKNFADSLTLEMEQHDEIEKTKIYRIYRDVRFSKDKSPYKQHLSGFMVRATKWKRGGLYFHFQPGGESMISGGFWNPNTADLARIRQEIAVDDSSLRDIVNAKDFKKHFDKLDGNRLKTAPRGYAKDHPSVEFLRHKQFLISEKFTDEEVTSKGFLKKAVTTFRTMRPFLDYMSDVLTTDANGEPLQ
jgi:uncharacterized protein (TIGR02453 family)